MKTVLMFTLPLIALILIATPLVPVFRKSLSGKQAKHRLAANLCAFFGFCILAVLLPAGGAVSAAADAGSVAASSAGMAYLGAALSAGLACIGAGIAVASGASAAIGAVSEDPKSVGKALIFVVLGEGIAIYGLLIAILILNRV